MEKIFLPVIAGPTASGKTELSIRLAQCLNGEIVSADSMQVYDGLYIGTARPLADEQQGVPHHLMGFLPLSHAFSVAEYCELAHGTIADIVSRGRTPILCGGTGLYIQAVTENLSFSQEDRGDRRLREELQKRVEAEGGQALLDELSAIDPATAARLHPNDTGRIVRALELYAVTGRTMSEQNALSRQEASPYDVRMIVLDVRNRAFLYDRINRRVNMMLDDGLLEEATEILRSPYAPTAMQAIGYKELRPFVDGQISLSKAVENLKQGTRRYAKRQLSWFRRIPNAVHIYIDDYADADQLFLAVKSVLLD